MKKLARTPDGGRHRVLGRAQGRKNRHGYGYVFIHTVLGGHPPATRVTNLSEQHP